MYTLIKRIYDAKQSVHNSTASALSGENLGRRQALEAIVGTAIGLKSFLSHATAEESAKSNKKYSYNDFKGIEEVIPNGSYNVQVFAPPEGVEKDFLYIITPLNGSKADIQEPYYVSELGVKTPQQLADLIKQIYGNSLKPFELMTDTIEHKKALVGYTIGKRNSIEVADVRPNKARPNRAKGFSIYLRAPGSYQGAGGGSGGGGAGGAGGSGGSGCFTTNTKVLMADGSFKPIASINVEEEVESYDFKSQKATRSKVSRLFSVKADSFLRINGSLEVTEKHPFAIGMDAWKEAGALKIGDSVVGKNRIKLKSIKKVNKAVQVFNLTVNGTHNFFVSDGENIFLVHNKGGGN